MWYLHRVSPPPPPYVKNVYIRILMTSHKFLSFKAIIFLCLLLPLFITVSAQEMTDSVYADFSSGKADIGIALLANEQRRDNERSSFYMGIKSNMLYDALLVPNIGVEFYWGRNWSAACNWMYAWWSNDRRHHYWRTYGGDVEIRYWFKKRTGGQPLKGHHMGLYGQMLTYDFELGGKGYLADKWTYGCGVSYGYLLPVARRLGIDFAAGIGYVSGQYKKYLPIDNHYVWQSTHNRNSIFLTKVEVSLIWLIGNENPTRKKGGRQ